MAEMKSPNAHAKKNRNDTPRKRKTHIIKVRVTAEEKLRIAYACKELHLTQSELVRRVLYGVNVKHTVVVAQGGEDALAALAALSAQCTLRAMLNERGLETDIQVDGGIYAFNVKEALDAGANVIVAGSAVFKGNAGENTRELMEILKNYE